MQIASDLHSKHYRSHNVEHDDTNSLQFIGRYGGYTDNDSGLTYFWHRWYDAKDGRWISRDPLGIEAGINLQKYVENNCMRGIDPYGLATAKPIDDPSVLPTPIPKEELYWNRCPPVPRPPKKPPTCMESCAKKCGFPGSTDGSQVREEHPSEEHRLSEFQRYNCLEGCVLGCMIQGKM